MIEGTTVLSTEDKIELITKAFTKKELLNNPASDMMDSTLKVLLNKHKNKEHNETTRQEVEAITPLQKEEEYRTKITTLLSKYEEIDNQCPDTETESQVNTSDISGSEEEVIDYNGPSAANRDDLPEVGFDYKNKDHVNRLLEAAKSMIY